MDTPFAVVNTMLFQDGVYLRVPRGVSFPAVVHLVHVTTPHATASHPRHVLVVEPGAAVNVVSDHVSDTAAAPRPAGSHSPAAEPGPPYLSNPVFQIELHDNAAMHFYKLVREDDRVYHLGATSVRQARDSRFTAFSLVRGGRLIRQDLECEQRGEGAESVLHGLSVLCGDQVADDHTTVVHGRPQGSSREFYKTILDDRAQGVFHGKVVVETGAIGTNAQQSSKNLLLSQHALMNTEPQLEISTDDVKCGHGATIGQLDREALFYLRTRGLDEGLARALLTEAFASDLIAALPDEAVRQLVQGYLTFPLCRRPGRPVPRSES
jgi:Fe-S cluster assembly protein SufD